MSHRAWAARREPNPSRGKRPRRKVQDTARPCADGLGTATAPDCAMNRNPHAAATESARGSARGGPRVGEPQARHPESRCRRGAKRSLQLRAPAPAPRPRCPARGASAAAERAGCSLRCAASLPGSVMIKIGCHCPNVIIPSVWPIVCQPSSREKKAQTFDEERCQK